MAAAPERGEKEERRSMWHLGLGGAYFRLDGDIGRRNRQTDRQRGREAESEAERERPIDNKKKEGSRRELARNLILSGRGRSLLFSPLTDYRPRRPA